MVASLIKETEMKDIIAVKNNEDETLTINKVHFNQEQSQIVTVLIDQYMTIKNAYNQLIDETERKRRK